MGHVPVRKLLVYWRVSIIWLFSTPSLQWPGCPCSQDRLQNWAHWPGVGFALGMGAVEVGEFDGDNHSLFYCKNVITA